MFHLGREFPPYPLHLYTTLVFLQQITYLQTLVALGKTTALPQKEISHKTQEPATTQL